MSKCWWKQPVTAVERRRPVDWRRLAWRLSARLIGACPECRRRDGRHKISCDTLWRMRAQKRTQAGLDG